MKVYHFIIFIIVVVMNVEAYPISAKDPIIIDTSHYSTTFGEIRNYRISLPPGYYDGVNLRFNFEITDNLRFFQHDMNRVWKEVLDDVHLTDPVQSLELELNDEGKEGDMTPADRVFSKKIAPPATYFYRVEIEAADQYGNKTIEKGSGVYLVHTN